MPESPSFLLLAPHLEYPPRNGADIAVAEIARALSAHVARLDVVAASETVRVSEGVEVSRRTFGGGPRPKAVAAGRAFLRQSHYLLEKFVTPAFTAEAARHLVRPDVGVVCHSFLSTASVAVLPDARRRHLVLTHNDEFAWFADLHGSVANPIGKAAAAASSRWIERFLTRHRRDLTLLHFTEPDREGWERRVPDHASFVVPIGVAVRGEPAPPVPPGASVTLFFAGALGVKMNLDALDHFADRFLPVMRDRLGDALSIVVAGSSPLPEVRALCDRHGWALHADVSDAAMDALFRGATFSLLPFPYATGAKLKLLKSLAYGVPALCTDVVGAQSDLIVHPSLMSDAPGEWADHVASLQERGLTSEDRDRNVAIARAHSWDRTAQGVLKAAISPA